VTNSPNVELARSIYAGWAHGAFSEVEWAQPDIEYSQVGDGPAPGTWKGLAEMAEAVRNWFSAWEDFRMVAEEYREVDRDRVLVLAQQLGRGKRSGLEMKSQAASLFEMRGGKVTRLIHYTSHNYAFADLGLAPEGDTP
jgi:ketosteroid isomerase-like protein